MWLPELFNMQAKYSEAHPGEGATFCFAAQNRNITSSRSRALVNEEPACVTDIKQQVFIDTLIMGTVSTLMPLPGALIVNLFGKKKLLSELSCQIFWYNILGPSYFINIKFPTRVSIGTYTRQLD